MAANNAAFQQWLIDKVEGTFVGQYQVTKSVSFMDFRLGLLNCGMMVGAVIVASITLSTGGFYSEEAGQPNIAFWYEGESAMQQAGNFTDNLRSGLPYCMSNDEYDYNYAPGQQDVCDDGRYRYDFPKCEVDNYWDDTQILCRRFSYGEVAAKFAQQGFVRTFAKQSHVTSRECSAYPTDVNANPPFICPTSPTSTQRQRKSITNTPHGRLCTCKTTQDFFAVGAEKLKLAFEHSFGTSQALDTEINGKTMNWRGSSSTPKDNVKGGVRAITTFVYKNCPNGVSWDDPDNNYDDKCKRVKKFSPGVPVVFSVEEWLDLANINLDEPVAEGAVSPDRFNDRMPMRRTVGVNLAIYLTYTGFTDRLDEPMKCALEVRVLSEGWGSASSTNTYDVQRTIEIDSTDQDYIDTYPRGVKFEFIAAGYLRKWDMNFFFSVLLTTVIFILTFIPAIMSIAVYYWPGRSEVCKTYQNVAKEVFDKDRALAAYAVHAASAVKFMHDASDVQGGLTRKALKRLLEKVVGDNSEAVTEFVFREMKRSGAVSGERDEETNQGQLIADKEMAELLSPNYSNLDVLVDHSNKNITEDFEEIEGPTKDGNPSRVHPFDSRSASGSAWDSGAGSA